MKLLCLISLLAISGNQAQCGPDPNIKWPTGSRGCVEAAGTLSAKSIPTSMGAKKGWKPAASASPSPKLNMPRPMALQPAPAVKAPTPSTVTTTASAPNKTTASAPNTAPAAPSGANKQL